MKIVLMILILVFANISAAESIRDVEPTLVGMEGNGGRVYVGISDNTIYQCSYGGIYFLDERALDKALSVAMSAKLAGKKLRIDFSQPDGVGAQCLGHGIYMQ